jgi:glycosyltransferase involved in cell wall biosynthesis
MKSVLVCAAQAPFVTGGAELLVRDLAAGLRRRGFRVDVVSVPFHAHPPRDTVRQALAWRLLELRETDGARPDLVIPTKFPSYLVRHPRKVAWVFHQLREAYDLHGTAFSAFSDAAEDRAAREAIHAMDRTALGECRALFAISRNVADRLVRFNRLTAEPLAPPPPHLGRYRTGEYGGFLLWAGRLEPIKRPDLAVRALAAARPDLRLRIAGRGPLEGELRRLADRLGVGERVELLGWVGDEELLELYAGCRAVLYAPLDEDYGYVAAEALLSGKPVLTTHDAGGPLELVEDGASGFVCPPEPEALGAAVDRVAALPERRLREMGEHGRRRAGHPGWDAVVDRLTETLR